MHKDVRLTWRGDKPKAPPMEVEAGSLLYNEATSEVLLSPWSKFRRDTLSMEGGNAVVKLEEGSIRTVEALSARGVDKHPARTLEYAADTLHIRFGLGHTLEHVTGNSNARLLSTTATSKTNVNSERLDLEFTPGAEESVLRTALATGGTVIESNPVPRKGPAPPEDTRILKSQIVSLHMRENGTEIDRVETDSPGHVEFLPNRPGGRRRSVEAERMTIYYGANNQARSFTAVSAATRTEQPAVRGRKPQPPALTWSKGLAAHFDNKTGAMTKLEQWDNFRYREGDRQARANRADFETGSELIVLTGNSRVWDPSGSTDADRITMNQKSGEFEAMGSVSSTRLPDQKKADSAKKEPGGGMLGGNEPVQAKANRMTTTGDNSVITYEGNSLMWQGANRISAQLIRIDRKASRLTAAGQVLTRLLDKEDPKKKKEQAFTVVRSTDLDYDEKTRLAHYRGGVTLVRGITTVTAKEIRAWLAPEGSASSLQQAFADGNVRIVQTAKDRNRTGTSEHAEFYTAEEKIILTGGQPRFEDSAKGSTTGTRITYFTGDDRLHVEGESKKPVESRILRKGS
jgi:lipopolysaccharide export system protein LptA